LKGTLVKLSYPVVATLALLASYPMIASAQASAPGSVLYAALDSPAASYSSSLAPEGRFDAVAKGASASSASAGAATVVEGNTRPLSALGIGFKIGLGGIGFDVATPLVPGFLNLRGGAGFFSYNTTINESNNNIVDSLKLNNAEIMGDFFPFHGSFRLSGGVTVYNNTALNGTISAPSGGTLSNGNNKYYSDPASPLGATAGFKFGGTAVPRVTLGWGNMVPKTGHIRFEVELGAEFIGNPTVTWNVTGMGCTTASPTPTGATACNNSANPSQSTAWGPVPVGDQAAQLSLLQSNANYLKVFPIFNIGLSYKF